MDANGDGRADKIVFYGQPKDPVLIGDWDGE